MDSLQGTPPKGPGTPAEDAITLAKDFYQSTSLKESCISTSVGAMPRQAVGAHPSPHGNSALLHGLYKKRVYVTSQHAFPGYLARCSNASMPLHSPAPLSVRSIATEASALQRQMHHTPNSLASSITKEDSVSQRWSPQQPVLGAAADLTSQQTSSNGPISPDSGTSEEQPCSMSQSLGDTSTSEHSAQEANSGPTSGTRLEKLELEGSTVEDALKLLRRICDVLGGRLPNGDVIDRSSVRAGTHAAVVDCTDCSGCQCTLAFFPVWERKRRQMKMYDKGNMNELMPALMEESDGLTYTDAQTGHKVRLPAHTRVERCVPLLAALEKNETHSEQDLVELLKDLVAQLLCTHNQTNVLRDITVQNVVWRARSRSWSLLEFTSAGRAGSKTEAVPVLSMPPEVACTRLSGVPITMEAPYDMWRLGILVYEAAQGTTYWPLASRPNHVLVKLANESMVLPHEATPVEKEWVQHILAQLLARSPQRRVTSAQFKVQLDARAIHQQVHAWDTGSCSSGDGQCAPPDERAVSLKGESQGSLDERMASFPKIAGGGCESGKEHGGSGMEHGGFDLAEGLQQSALQEV